MKIITCETWGELKVGVPISSDMRGRFLSLANEETSRANLKDHNPAYLDYYNAWIDELSKQQIYQSKVYLSPRIPPDMIDLSSRIISDDHYGTMRNTKIYDAYPAYYRQKIHKASYGSELNRVLELVDGRHYETCLMQFPVESLLLCLEIHHWQEPSFPFDWQNIIAVGLSYQKQADERYYFVSRQLCVVALNDVLRFSVHCCRLNRNPKIAYLPNGKPNPLLMQSEWEELVMPQVELSGQQLYNHLNGI